MTTNESAPGEETRGAEDERLSGGYVTSESTRHPYIVAVEMLADSADRERAIFETAWSAGYAAGFDAGTEIGYDCAEAQMAEAWAPVAESVRRLGRTLNHAELELRRWDGRREEFGKPRPGDYMGGPVSWDGRRASA
ncbi:hypothetical protein E1287_14225 [Actinomadura sp. KC06]|uniref:hypothetical protein n=1 Tax=Actinomadura sp. KC06 TaxID=2530369 RepID=UPI00104FBA91|nr:hypothetical protein [Actinomadura sp. KC06]TDD35264.1 hypothetical protein E1287_14225 [Actinomadura sp. KC06]